MRLGTAVTVATLALTTAGLAGEDLVRHPAPARVVALGDWHGDLDAARRGLRLAGAIDAEDHWCGGELVVVQTGDRLDRGDGEQAILDLLQSVSEEAAAAGGAVHALLGNHELMNVAGDFRYVTEGGWSDFADAGIVVDPADSTLMALPPAHQPRAAAFHPGSRYARLLATGDVALILGRTVFVHGGILPGHLEYGLGRLNREVRAWLLGVGPEPELLKQGDAPTWARQFSDEPDGDDCALLERVLAGMDCDRMVVGHTVQDDGITARCGERVWCIDTGASAHYGGPVQVLEITNEGVKVLQ